MMLRFCSSLNLSSRCRAILAAIPQCGDIDHQFRHPEEQVFPERLRLNHVLQIAVRGANDPHVYGNLLATAQSLDHALLQETQHLGLDWQGHVTQLIEEQGSAFGRFDLARRALVSSGEGPLFVAEQFALDERLWYCCAVDRNKWLVRARRKMVNRTRNHFFAGAALALEKA